MLAHVTCIVNHAILKLKYLLHYHVSLLSNNEVKAPEEEGEERRRRRNKKMKKKE
jgi:hypothetical protein